MWLAKQISSVCNDLYLSINLIILCVVISRYSWAINNKIVLKLVLKRERFLRNKNILCYHLTSYNWSWDWSPFVVAPDPPYWCPLLVGAPWWCPWWWCPWWCESVGVVLRSPAPLLPAAMGRSALPPPLTYNKTIVWHWLQNIN